MRGLQYVTILILLCVVSVSVASAAGSVDEATVARLEKLIQSQQQQLELQQQQLQALQQQMSQFQSAGTAVQTQSTETKTASLDSTNKGVTSGSDKVKLVLSGQINRAINIVDDGDNTEAYFVDSAASNSKFRLVGTAKLPDDLTLGLRMEIAVAPNVSSDVNQDSAESGDYFDQRYADLSLAQGYRAELHFLCRCTRGG